MTTTVVPGVLIATPDAEHVAREAAIRMARTLRDAIQARGVATTALSGGNTPRRAYALLAGDSSVDWAKVEVFWVDERAVDPDHAVEVSGSEDESCRGGLFHARCSGAGLDRGYRGSCPRCARKKGTGTRPAAPFPGSRGWDRAVSQSPFSSTVHQPVVNRFRIAGSITSRSLPDQEPSRVAENPGSY